MVMSISKKKSKDSYQDKQKHNKKNIQKYTKKNINNASKLCSMEYNGNTIDKHAVIICLSIFKLDDMYRNITIYLDGLKRIITAVKKFNLEDNKKYHIILYYDHSVEKDIEFNKIVDNIQTDINNNLSCVTLCKYKCPQFITNNLHRGLFGTFMRFYPLFNKQFENNLKIIADVDQEDIEILYYLKYIPETILKTNHKFVILQPIGYEFIYKNLFTNKYLNGTALATCYSRNYTFPLEYLENFLYNLLGNNKNYIKISKIISELIKVKNKDNIPLQKKEKYKDLNVFSYGIDELFLNLYFIDYIISKISKIGIIYINDNLRLYPLEMINWSKSNINYLQQFLKDFLNELFSENIIRTKYNMICNKIYNKININKIYDYNKYKINERNLFYLYKLLSSKYKNKLMLDKNYLDNLEKHTQTHNKIPILTKSNIINNDITMLSKLAQNTEIYTLCKH